MKRIFYWMGKESHSKYPIWITLLILFLGSYKGVSLNMQDLAIDTTAAGQFNLKAVDFARAKDYDSAIIYFEKAAANYLAANVWDRFFYAHYQIGYMFNGQRKYSQTFQHLDSIESNNATHLTPQLNSYQNFYGVLAWSQFSQFNYEKALNYFEILDNGASQNTEVKASQILFSKYHQGVIYQRIGQYDRALKLMLLTKNFGNKTGESFYLGRTYNNLGIIYRNLGEYERALEFYQKALKVEQKTKKEVTLTPLYNNLGMIYFYLGDYEAALTELNYALGVLRSVTSDYYSVESALINTKAKVLIGQGEYAQAKIILEQVLAREIEKYNKIGPHSGSTIQTLGRLHSRMGDYALANGYFDQMIGITINTIGSKNDRLVEDYNFKAENLLQTKSYEEALQSIQLGIISLVEGFNEQDYRENPGINSVIFDKVELINSLYLKSKVLLALYSKSHDINYLHVASTSNNLTTELTEIVRKNMLYESSKMNLSKTAKNIYEQDIEISLLLEKETKYDYTASIFEAMENSKAYLLTESMQKAKALGYSNLPDYVLSKEDSFRTNIKILEAKRSNNIIRSKDTRELAQINEQLFKEKELFEEYKQAYVTNTSAYQHNMLQIPDFQANFAENELIIEYFAGESQLYSIAISKNKVKIYELGEYQEPINEFVRSVKQVRDLDATAYQSQANEVYNIILAPILADFKQAKRLVIIPDKQIGFIPFDALITNTVDNPRYNSLSYLLNNYTLIQHQTVGLYVNQQHQHEKTANQFIGFAPDFDESDLLVVANNQLRGDLQPLPYAKKEVEAISNLLDGEGVTGPNASETYLKTMAASFNILHLATHAIIDEENPLYSKLVFALSDSTAIDDGELYSFEIYGMKLNCALVTLSACNTGTGKYLDGEGIFSLGRSFLLAGAESVLTSLWEVSDQSTSQIMESFYANIKNGETSPEAIRMAKLKYLKSSDPLTANPHYWAGFVYIGQSEKVFSSNRIYFWFAAFGLLFIFSTYLTIKLKKKSSLDDVDN